MKTYTIRRVTGRPDWSSIPSLPIDQVHKADTAPVRAWGQIAYDEDCFWVRLRAEEANIRKEETGPLASTWEDSCLEFFFSPVEGDCRYINIETNAGGSFYMGVGIGKPNLYRLIPRGTQYTFAPEVTFFEGGWEVSYCLPFPMIRCLFPSFAPKSGDILRANCYKCGDKTVEPHWLSWSRVDAQPLNFHLPEFFGTMIFE